jgi:hypothetical protein
MEVFMMSIGPSPQRTFAGRQWQAIGLENQAAAHWNSAA